MSADADKHRDRPADKGSRKDTAAPDDREARLAAALRANLRRRKAATRAPEPRDEPKEER
jgi:hypothetical protein